MYQTIVHFKKTGKNIFVNNFCVPELQALKFLTLKETIVAQICAAQAPPNFHSGKSYFEKITVFTFQQFVPTSHVKLRSLNQKLQVWVFQGQDFAFRAAIKISFREIAAKRVTAIFFSFYFNNFENCFTLVTILIGKVRPGILDACVCKNIFIKEKLGKKLIVFY